MIKKITLLVLILNCLNLVGQNQMIYANDDLEIITKKEFDKIKKEDGYLKLKFTADTVLVNVNVKRVKKGKISISLLDSIKSNLSSDSEYFNKNDIVVINYYPGKDNCNTTGNKNSAKLNFNFYFKRIKKQKNVKQFFVYKSIEGTESYGDLDWLNDKEGFIENIFFPIHYPCGSFVLIDSKGNYYCYRSEYNFEEIFNLLWSEDTF